MIRKTVAQLAAMIPGATVGGPWDAIPIAGVSKDTRSIPPGCLYVPLIGERFDGHAFVKEAAEKGAAASLWQRDRGDAPAGVPVVLVDDSLAALQQLASAYRKELPVKVVGITGSNGKTSTKDMVGAVLETKYRVLKTQGNLNNHIGLPMTLLALDNGTDIAVLEMGMSGFGEIELLSRIAEPDCAIITNIGEAHMLQLGSREGIATAKFEIVAGLKRGGTLIFHGDEPLLQNLAERAGAEERYRCVRFGVSDTNDYYPYNVSVSADCSEFSVARSPEPERIERLRIPLLGRHNVVNALSAVAAAELFEVPEAELRSGLAGMKPTGMRIEALRTDAGAVILNDAYNASPASMSAALRLMEELTVAGGKIAVLGDMLELGPESERFHREIGRSLSPGCFNRVFTYGKLAAYIAEECKSRFAKDAVEAFDDKQLLIEKLAGLMRPKDMVLVKASRGMRLEEVVDAIRHI